MQRHRLSYCLATTLLTCAADFADTQAYKKDDIVVVIANAPLKINGNHVVGSVHAGILMPVGAVNGNWLWVKNGECGWLPKSCVIPVNEKAIDRLTKLIKANPRDAGLFAGRAAVWWNLLECNNAIAEFSKAIADCDLAIHAERHYASDEGYRFIRAVAQFVQRQAEAADGFQQVIDLPNFGGERWKGALAADSVILGCLAARLSNDQQRADRFLKEAEGKLGDAWETTFIQYLQGRCIESVVLETAQKCDRMFQTHCYFGLDALSKADTQKAKREFDWVIKNGAKGTSQVVIAEAELKRLAVTSGQRSE